uniref:Uncharacterized protein n=1 Tax=Panagrolaimus davidi TaxID=227884 RepID=A0A914PBU8_9BILA
MSLRNGALINATSCGNYSRFVNHSCDPNAETQKWVVSRDTRIGFFAKKNIANCKGEEIVFDYAFERYGKDAQECFCGSENCTGFIGSKPNEDENDEEEANPTESTSEAYDDEKSKMLQLKRMAKARRKLVKDRREFRQIVGRKKNFSADDVLEFNRQMYRINDYNQRFLIINFLLTFPDEQWKKNFTGSHRYHGI